MWVYYSALILLFGAEFTHVYALATRREGGADGPRDGRQGEPGRVSPETVPATASGADATRLASGRDATRLAPPSAA